MKSIDMTKKNSKSPSIFKEQYNIFAYVLLGQYVSDVNQNNLISANSNENDINILLSLLKEKHRICSFEELSELLKSEALEISPFFEVFNQKRRYEEMKEKIENKLKEQQIDYQKLLLGKITIGNLFSLSSKEDKLANMEKMISNTQTELTLISFLIDLIIVIMEYIDIKKYMQDRHEKYSNLIRNKNTLKRELLDEQPIKNENKLEEKEKEIIAGIKPRVSLKNDNEIFEEKVFIIKTKSKITNPTIALSQLEEKDIRDEFTSMLKERNIQIIHFSDLNFSRKNLLGKGGVGRVYKGTIFNSEVAIKEYSNYNIFDNFHDNETLELLAEIVNSISLNIPKVNKCYGASIDEKGVLYTIHELAVCSLKEKMKEEMDLKEKNEIVKQMLEILINLYKMRIIHRDLKPENFLLTKFGELQICDFGTIRKLNTEETYTLNATYTVRYAPPEFINDLNIAGSYSDIWSLGIILYQIYYGEDLWKGYKEKQIEESVKMNKIPNVEYSLNVPKEITNIIKESLKIVGKERISISEINKKFDKMH